MKILNTIQKELNAPKSQRNNFGNYNYRSCEDILSAVKPLLGDATLLLSDEIVLIGERYYVKATATFKEGKDEISVSAYAREDASKKGMDLSQLTGSCSSYARKYALNGLFCIDDTKDADTQDNTQTYDIPHAQGGFNSNDAERNAEKEWFNMLNKDGTPDDMKWAKILNLLNKGLNAEQIINKIRETKNINKKEMDYIRGNL
jgi:hypothetical protein